MDVGSQRQPAEHERDRIWVWRSLWKPKSKLKLALAIPDTVLLEDGAITRWLFTSKDDNILKRGSGNAAFGNVLSRFQNLYGQQQMNCKVAAKLVDGAALIYSSKQSPECREIDLPSLSKLCAGGTQSSKEQRMKTDILQFKVVGRTGEQLLYHNSYNAANPLNGRGVVATSTHRIRFIEETVAQSSAQLTSSSKSSRVNSLVVMQAQNNLKRLVSMDRAFNAKLDKTTQQIVKFIEGRRKCTVSKFTAEYSIDPNGNHIFINARNVSTFENFRKYQSSLLPNRIRVEFDENKPNGSVYTAAAAKELRLASTTDRALQFYTRGDKEYVTGNGVQYGSEEKTKMQATIQVIRKKCHGDFCDFQDDEIAEEEAAAERPSSSNSTDSSREQWTRQRAVKKEWAVTSTKMSKLREHQMKDTIVDVQAEIDAGEYAGEVEGMERTFRGRLTSSPKTKIKTRKKRENKVFTLAYRLISNARIDSEYMSDKLTRWYMTTRAKQRSGDGPWLHFIAPTPGKKYKSGMMLRCVWDWAGIIACTKIQLFCGFTKVYDVVMSTKNDGLYVFEIPAELLEGLELHMRGNMWRLKICDTSNPNTFNYSARFSIGESTPARKVLNPGGEHGDSEKKFLNLMQDLDTDEIEQMRVSKKLCGMAYYLNTEKQNKRVPPSMKYSEVTVCRQCYLVYNRLQLRKRDCMRLKDAGCVLDDLGQVIAGQPPVNRLIVRPLDETRLEKQMKAIVDGPEVDVASLLRNRPNAKKRHEKIVRRRENREQLIQEVNDRSMTIESNLARGLGVSQEALDDFDKMYDAAIKAGVVPDAPALRNADFVKRKVEKLAKLRPPHGQSLGQSGMFSTSQQVVGASRAWEPSQTRPEGFFDNEEGYYSSDDEPLMGGSVQMKFEETFGNAPKLPPSVSVGPRKNGWTVVSGLNKTSNDTVFVASSTTQPSPNETEKVLAGLKSKFQEARKKKAVKPSFDSPTKASSTRLRKKSVRSVSMAELKNLSLASGSNAKSGATKKRKPNNELRSTASINSRYASIIPLLEARGAGARETRDIVASPKRKKIPWKGTKSGFDASSPAHETVRGGRRDVFGEPRRPKRLTRKARQRKDQERKEHALAMGRLSHQGKSPKRLKKGRSSSPQRRKKRSLGKQVKKSKEKNRKGAKDSMMPYEIRHNPELRKVICVLVLGQLADIRHLLRVYSAQGTRGLAASFANREPETEYAGESEGLPTKKVAWLLENFICCANVFASLFAPGSARPSGKSRRFFNTIGVSKGADADPNVPWSSETVTNDAMNLVKEFIRWFNVGLPRYLIFEGVSHWVAGSVVLAHQKWCQAAIEAKRSSGPTSYDAGVAYFLIGRHMDTKTQTVERKKHLRMALNLFRKLDGEAKEEESVLERELHIPPQDNKRVTKIVVYDAFNAQIDEDETTEEPQGLIESNLYANYGPGENTRASTSESILEHEEFKVTQTSLKDLWEKNQMSHDESEEQFLYDAANVGVVSDTGPITPGYENYSGDVDNVPPPTADVAAIMTAPITPGNTAGTMFGPVTPDYSSAQESDYKGVATMYGPTTPGYNALQSGPITPGYEHSVSNMVPPPQTADVEAIMNAPVTPGTTAGTTFGPITPDYSKQQHITGPITPGYESLNTVPPPQTADVEAIMNAPITPGMTAGTAFGPITPDYSEQQYVAGPITPGYENGYNTSTHPPPTAEVAAIMNAPITPGLDSVDIDMDIDSSENAGGIHIVPLYKKEKKISKLPPLHTQEAQLRVRKLKAEALSELRQKNFKQPIVYSDSEESAASTIRDLRESHEDDVKILKVKLQSEKRRQKSVLQRKLEEGNLQRVNKVDDASLSQEGQLSIVRTDSTSEVAVLKNRLLRERERQRETLKRKLDDRRRKSQLAQKYITKVAEAAYTFYAEEDHARLNEMGGETAEPARETNSKLPYDHPDSSPFTYVDLSPPKSAEGAVSHVGEHESVTTPFEYVDLSPQGDNSVYFNSYKNPSIGVDTQSPTSSHLQPGSPSPSKKTSKALISARLGNMSDILFTMISQRKTLALNAMLDAGSDVFARNEGGNTLLIEAAKLDDMDMMHMLIAHGGKKLLDAQNFEGNTALHFIFERNDAIGASFLVANGADEHIVNMYGLPARDGVKLKNFKELNF